MISRRHLASAACALLVACAHAPAPPNSAAPWPLALAPAAARSRAAQASDPIEAVDLAWVLGNDRAQALRLAERASPPTLPARVRAALALRRGLLRASTLDPRAAIAALLDAHDADPGSPEAELAAELLSDLWLDELRADRSLLAHEGLDARLETAAARAQRPGAIWALSRTLQHLSRTTTTTPARALRTGAILTAEVIGPLGPAHPLALRFPEPLERDPSAPLPALNGLPVEVRSARARDLELVPSAERSGLFLVRAPLTLDRDADVVLGVLLPTLGRVSIDGQLVFARSSSGPVPPRGAQVPVRLTAGRHQLTVLMLASPGDGLRLAVLGTHGEPVLAPTKETAGRAAAQAQPALGPSPPTAETPLLGLPHAVALLDSLWALRASRHDVATARAALLPATDTATRSAALRLQDARVAVAEGLGLPTILAQYRQVLVEDPTHARVLIQLAEAVLDTDADEARALAERARAATPASPEPDLVLAEAARRRHDTAALEAALRRALALTEDGRTLDAALRFFRTELRLSEAQTLENKRRALRRSADVLPEHPSAEALLRALDVAAASSAHPELERARAIEIETLRGATARARARLEAARLETPGALALLRAELLALAPDERPRAELVAALRAQGAADLELETWLARREGRTPGVPRGLDARLAVQPTALAQRPIPDRWAEAERVRLLDRVVDEVRADGSAISLRHSIVRLQTKEATDGAGELQLPDGAVTLALRTLKADGTTLEVDRHAGKEDVSFSGLAPGDAVEEHWVALDEPASMFGGYARRFLFRTDVPSLRSELVVVVPKPLRAEWTRYHGAPAPEVLDEPDRTVYIFRADDVDASPFEPGAVPFEEFLPFVIVNVGLPASTALRANLALAEGVGRTNAAVERWARHLIDGATTPEARFERIVSWVDAHVAHGPGADVGVVFATRRGDRTTLLTTLFRAAGLPTRVLLVRPGTESDLETPYPDPRHFRVAVLDVDLGPSGRRLLRTSVPKLVVGLPAHEFRGGQFIEVPEDGAVSSAPRIQRLEPAQLEVLTLGATVRLRADARGSATGTITFDLPGYLGEVVREGLEPLREDQRAQGFQGYLGAILPGARVLTHAMGPRPEGAGLQVTLTLALDHLFEQDGDRWVANSFFASPLALRLVGLPTLEAYLGLSARKMPLLLAEAHERLDVEVELDPSAGPAAEAPESFTLSSSFATLRQFFRQERGRVVLQRQQEVQLGRVSVADFAGFRELAQEAALRSRNRLVLRREGRERAEDVLPSPTSGHAGSGD